MKDHRQETTAQANHLATTTNRKVLHSSHDGKIHAIGQGIKKTALERLLETDKAFYRKESARLAVIARRLKVPRAVIDNVVDEAWARAVKRPERFADVTKANIKPRLHGFLRKVVHDKSVDVIRHQRCFPCPSLDAEGIEPIDDAEVKRAETAELHEMLDALIERICQGHEENLRLLRAHFFSKDLLSRNWRG